MPPIIALILCLVFVVLLLYVGCRRRPGTSRVLWIPTVWMLCIASKPVGVWFGIGGDATASQLDQLFFSGLFCLGLFILAWRGFSWSSAIRENKWLILLICYMLISVLWSDIPYTSFKRWSRELIAVVMAFLVLSERDPRQAVLSVFRIAAYILVPFSLLLIKYFPQYGVEFEPWSGSMMWTGVTTQKNGLGRLCLISAFFLVWTLVRRWQGREMPAGRYRAFVDCFVLAMTLWLLRGTAGGAYSATSTITLVAGIATLMGLLWMKKHRAFLGANTLTVMMIIGISFGIGMVMVGGFSLGGLTSSLGRDETLTGRTAVWAQLLPVAIQHPILGLGFGGFWTPYTSEVTHVPNAHSGYLDVLLSGGFVGLLLVSMFLLSSCRKACRELTHDYDWAALWIAYLLMTVIYNVSETTINSFANQLNAVLLFLAVSSTTASSRKVEENVHHM